MGPEHNRAEFRTRPGYDRSEELRKGYAANQRVRDELDDIIDRIEERMKLRAEGQYLRTDDRVTHEQDFINRHRSDTGYAGEETVCAESLLGTIERRIETAACRVEETAYRLNNHADRVHGSAPPSPHAPSPTLSGADKPEAMIRRILDALDTLDQMSNFVAEAAERNMALA